MNNIDWAAAPAAGTITVSDPKMYRREALINERNAEVAWLDELLNQSKTIDFKPEIAREIEQITALAAGLGLNFDPASALNYRRAVQTSDLQQQIDVMKLQLQLDQLKRDAELVRSKFATQTEPVNSGLGTVGTGTATTVTSPAPAAAADQLKAAIDKLSTTIETRLDAEGKAAALANTTANPVDIFRDRSAYRDLLKSTKNAASLDELHDLRGAALIRLNFQATVLPDLRHTRAPGIIQMRVVPPAFSEPDIQRLYLSWLDYINDRINVAGPTGWTTDTDLLTSAVADNFDTAEYLYAPSPANGARCPGFVFDAATAAAPGCASLVFAIPKFSGGGAQEGAYSSLAKYLQFFHFQRPDEQDRAEFQHARELVPAYAKILVPNCGLPEAPGVPAGSAPGEAQQLAAYLELARVRLAGGRAFTMIERAAQRHLGGRGAAASDGRSALIGLRTARAQMLLSTFENFAYVGCSDEQRRAFALQSPTVFVPSGFTDVLMGGEDRVSIYEIGPREQVQQVSTVARDANSLALAVSIAASSPASGLAANAAANYSRQAMGRAAALERVPAVVGYSLLSQRTFGWVLGPRATLDPRGRLELEQSLRTYDISVDLSVPSWWPSFGLEMVTAWAPQVATVANGAVAVTRFAQPRLIQVPLSQNDADFAALTRRIGFVGIEERREVVLKDSRLAGQAVSACRSTTLFVAGDNVWRASVALIGGQRLPANAITVAPDMSGILLDVPALGDSIGDVHEPTLPLQILTPYGEAKAEVDYAFRPAADCNAGDKKTEGTKEGGAQ